MGILSNHVPSIVQLKPGIIEVISEGNQSDKYFGNLVKDLYIDDSEWWICDYPAWKFAFD